MHLSDSAFGRETQAILEDELGLTQQVLSRGFFQGQHLLNGLLESTDAQLKEELALLVRSMESLRLPCPRLGHNGSLIVFTWYIS